MRKAGGFGQRAQDPRAASSNLSKPLTLGVITRSRAFRERSG